MKTRFKKNAKVFDIVITALAGMVSVAVMFYAIYHFGLKESWPELVLNLCGRHSVAARHPLCAAIGQFCLTFGMSHAVGAAAVHTRLLLCPKRLAELYQAQPVADMHHRHAHCRTLQLRHFH